MKLKHIISTQQFLQNDYIGEIFNLADEFQKLNARQNFPKILQGKLMASVFYEPSTRTRFSFESAMMRLGGDVLTMESVRDSSSDKKGETLEDAIKVINNYADAIVLRHSETGSAARAAAVSGVPIINAGDGNLGQHPTQALLDLYTVQRALGREDGIHIAFVGNLKYYRSARSLAYLISKYKDIHITFVSVPELQMGDDVKQHLHDNNIQFDETEDMQSVLKSADVLYQTRIAKEWIKNVADFDALKDKYIITRAVADSMKEGAIIIHPLPRVDEIEIEVDNSPHAVYFRQVGYGLLVRMALLKMILGGA